MATMTKKQYEAIAKPFKEAVDWKQYLYASRGFEHKNGSRKHSAEGRKNYQYFTDLDSIVFQIANALGEANSKFDRDHFLRSAGMWFHDDGSFSFVPGKDYIYGIEQRHNG